MICKNCGKVLDDDDKVCPRCGISRNFKGLLPKLVEDFGGIDIFSEENHSRLSKALAMSAESDSKKRDLFLIANMKHIPQRLYAAIESSKNEQEKVMNECFQDLLRLDIVESTCRRTIDDLAQCIYRRKL
jgi:RNA polymerase subunit RPABC4/transcription elongation factor Spt4